MVCRVSSHSTWIKFPLYTEPRINSCYHHSGVQINHNFGMIACRILHNNSHNYTDQCELVGNCDILLDSSTTSFALMAENVHAITAGNHLHSITIFCITLNALTNFFMTQGFEQWISRASKKYILFLENCLWYEDHAAIICSSQFPFMCKSQTA